MRRSTATRPRRDFACSRRTRVNRVRAVPDDLEERARRIQLVGTFTCRKKATGLHLPHRTAPAPCDRRSPPQAQRARLGSCGRCHPAPVGKSSAEVAGPVPLVPSLLRLKLSLGRGTVSRFGCWLGYLGGSGLCLLRIGFISARLLHRPDLPQTFIRGTSETRGRALGSG